MPADPRTLTAKAAFEQNKPDPSLDRSSETLWTKDTMPSTAAPTSSRPDSRDRTEPTGSWRSQETAMNPCGLQAADYNAFSTSGGHVATLHSDRCREVRLCLAFTSPSDHHSSGAHTCSTVSTTGLGSHQAYHHSYNSGQHLPCPLTFALTSPMPAGSLHDHLAVPRQEFRYPEPELTLDYIRWRLASILMSCRLCMWRGSMRGRSFGAASPSTVLLLLVVLFFADLMVFLLIGSILMHLNWAILTFFILAPPLTQPVAV